MVRKLLVTTSTIHRSTQSQVHSQTNTNRRSPGFCTGTSFVLTVY